MVSDIQLCGSNLLFIIEESTKTQKGISCILCGTNTK